MAGQAMADLIFVNWVNWYLQAKIRSAAASSRAIWAAIRVSALMQRQNAP
jgi:hypothetical protein